MFGAVAPYLYADAPVLRSGRGWQVPVAESGCRTRCPSWASGGGPEDCRLGIASCEQGAGNVHAAWRMAVARRAAEAYQGSRNSPRWPWLANSAPGVADRFSDLELDCYWFGPPTDTDRLAPVHSLGGELTHWGLRPGRGGVERGIPGRRTRGHREQLPGGLTERFLDDVVLRASTDPVRHMRLAAFQRSARSSARS